MPRMVKQHRKKMWQEPPGKSQQTCFSRKTACYNFPSDCVAFTEAKMTPLIVMTIRNLKLLPFVRLNCGRFCFSVCVFVCVCEISREPLNGFAPNSHGRGVWSLVRTSLKVKVKCHGHHVQKLYFWPFRRPACCLCLVNILASSFKLRS